jgi:hypothetical protein
MNTFKKLGAVLLVTILSVSFVSHVQAQNPSTVSTPGAMANPSTTNTPGAAANPSTTNNPGAYTNPPVTSTPGDYANPSTTNTPANTVFYIQNPLNSRFNSIGGIVQGALEIFSYVVVLFAVLMIIYVGLQFVLAQGKPERLKELKDWLLWIVIGVAVVIGARIIVYFVINKKNANQNVNTGIIQKFNI